MPKFEVLKGVIYCDGSVYTQGMIISLAQSQVQALRDLGHIDQELNSSEEEEKEEADDDDDDDDDDGLAPTLDDLKAERRAELEALSWREIARLAKNYELAESAPEGGWDTLIPDIVEYELT